jgi:multiple sugar transport system substrate-binding protein
MRYLRTQRSALAAAAAAAALALAVSACGGSSSSAGGHITLTVWTYYTGTGQIAALKAQDALFEKAHPNVTVQEVQVQGTQLDPKLLAAAAQHTGPDLFLDNVVVDFPELVAAKALSSLTQDWNSYPDKSQFPSGSIWKSGGQIYNVMSYTNLLGLYYNKTILDQYHLTPPTTIAQLQSEMKVITRAGKYSAMAASASPDTGGAWTWFPLLLEQGTNYCHVTTSNVEPMFSTVNAWTKAGYLPKEASTWAQNDSWTQFMTGKYAFGINGNWNLGAATAATFKWGTVQFPAGQNGTSQVFPGGEGLSIGNYSKYKKLDWEYLETSWLSQKASVIDFKDSGQIPTRADVADTPTVKSNAAAAPFITATKNVAKWPLNPKTDQMQVTVGTELSDVVSGQATPAKAATTTATAINADIKAGGGGC